DAPPPVPHPKPGTMKAARVEIPQIPELSFSAWREGRTWLSGNAAALCELAAWRTWPFAYVQVISRAGIIAAPFCYRERARVAFQVATSDPSPLGADYSPENAHRDRARFVGWHMALTTRRC